MWRDEWMVRGLVPQADNYFGKHILIGIYKHNLNVLQYVFCFF